MTKHTPSELKILEGFGQEDHIDPRYYIGSPDLPAAVFVTSGGNDKALAERLLLVWNGFDAALTEAERLEEENKKLRTALKSILPIYEDYWHKVGVVDKQEFSATQIAQALIRAEQALKESKDG